MKILHITRNFGQVSDAAAVLHSILPYLGVQSYLAFAKADGNFLCGGLPLFSEGYEQAEASADICKPAAKALMAEADIIHLHTADDRILVNVLPYLKALAKPVVWSVDSSRPYTGGCEHASVLCDRWRQSCTDCPEVASAEEKAQRQTVFAAKQSMYETMQLYPVGTSKWQADQLRQSMVQGVQACALPLPVASCFYPGDKLMARKILDLPQQSLVVIYRAADPSFLPALQQAFLSLKDRIRPVFIVCWGGELPFPEMSASSRTFAALDDAARAVYLRAADLYVDLRLDSVHKGVVEAAFCACPSVVLAGGCAGELIEENTGFILPSAADLGKSLWEIMLALLKDDSRGKALGRNAYEKVQRGHDRLTIARGFVKLYDLLGSRQTAAAPASVVSAEELLQSRMQQVTEQLKTAAGPELQLLFVEHMRALAQRTRSEQLMFADQFCLACLDTAFVEADPSYIWEVVKLWLSARKEKDMMACFSAEEKRTCLKLMRKLRACLTEYFKRLSLADFAGVDAVYSPVIVLLWQWVFLNGKSLLHIEAKAEDAIPDFSAYPALEAYPYACLQSMYMPYWEGTEVWSIKTVVTAKMPTSLRFILLIWLTSLPLYGAVGKNRQTVLHYIAEVCRNVMEYPAEFDRVRCDLLLCSFMGALWRVSYLGGNNSKTLQAYGDYVQAFVKRFMGEFSQPIKPRKRKAGEKLRVGYVSLRFKNQAVSQYMANRIFCHDREKFYVKTFMLHTDRDAMTERIAAASDDFVTFDGVANNAVAIFAKAIRESELDILIYADIGMDNITYQLGAMRLAPVQAVLVGHGTTTGLSSIDYYISGDHEPAEAQKHYVEKLICLPKLGCVQLPPQKSERVFARAEFGIPEDAVLFISCANALKHIPERDALLIEILRQAKDAYILLKPFQNTVSVDEKFIERLQSAAKAAGVEQRLIFVPPLQHPGDLMGLLLLADVQLDTYPYGGWTTNLEALYYHLPLVTQEGNMARNRWGAGLLRALGVKEGIAGDEKAYVKWAVRFAQDAPLRQRIAAKIAGKAKATLFDGEAGQAVYEDYLKKICR